MNSNQIHFLKPDFFLSMLKTGAHRVIAKESLLNQLNVFPVTDRDTGSNMAALMRFFLAQSFSTVNLPQLLKQIADTTLLGACGNSGMIVSAFFVGIASKQVPNDTFSIQDFINCLDKGVEHAYQAVSEPVEGTILTVMSAWHAACKKLANETNDFVFLFQKSIPYVEAALKETEHQLPILEQNGVVDAGALGFLELIYGMQDYLIKQDNTPYEEHFAVAVTAGIDHSHEQEPCYGYCAETLLANVNQNPAEIKTALEKLGDSLVINQSPSYLKIHFHTDDVLAMTTILKKFGPIQHQKVDSMKSQWVTAHKRKYPIALVTDSTADLPAEWIQNQQIHVLPLQVRLGQHTLLDRLTVNLDELYQSIHQDNMPAGTASPSPEIVARYLNFLGTHYDSIIMLTLSSKISGTYQMISNLSQKMTNTKITVIDSKTVSAAQGLLVMLASGWIANGDTHEVVVKKIQDAIQDTHFFVAVDEFKTMVKSGRAPQVIGLLAEWSHFKPIVTVNKEGKPSLAGMAIGENMSWNKIAKIIKKYKQLNKIQSACIVHTLTAEKAQKFVAFIEKQTGLRIEFITQPSPVIGLHAGKGCIAIATVNDILPSF